MEYVTKQAAKASSPTRNARIWRINSLRSYLDYRKGPPPPPPPPAHDSLNPALSMPGIVKLWITVRGFSLDSDRIEYAVQEIKITKKALKSKPVNYIPFNARS